MLPPWRAELRVGLCPTRLVLADGVRPVDGDPAIELRRIAKGRRATVVLSSHFVRHTVLPWSQDLSAEDDWLALARHAFAKAYGEASEAWDCRVSPAGRGEPRLASAVDSALLASLRATPGVVSVQPYLMGAFNACRKRMKRDAWLVLQEPGRLTLALMRGGAWRLARTRLAGGDWQRDLEDLLEREAAGNAEALCEDVFLYGEEEAPARLGRYQITDASRLRRPRALAMTCH